MKNTRNIDIDIWRFIAAIAIMMHHLYTTGLDISKYPLHDGNIYVEFFFLLTGFFTARHFLTDCDDKSRHDAAIENGFKYSFAKPRKLWGICAISTICQYLLMLVSTPPHKN